jgi:tetratricopeptide (TPR) repeat protein
MDRRTTFERQRARELEAADQPAAALVAIRNFLLANPDDANALLQKGRLLASLARYGEAEVALFRAQALFADESEYVVHRELGHLYRDWGRLEMALAAYQKVALLRPDHASGHIYSGSVLAVLGRFNEALAAHQRGTQCPEGHVDEAHYNLGLVLRSLERFEEARAHFERALELDPSDENARTALSDVILARDGSAGSVLPEPGV